MSQVIQNFIAGTGAVSRYNLSLSHKSVPVQDCYWVQMRVSGCCQHYKAVLVAETKAKTVTNNLPLLSVLCGVIYFFSSFFVFVNEVMLSLFEQSYPIKSLFC
jgi:hypothetical protein